jgi:CRISPR-associated protein Csm5
MNAYAGPMRTIVRVTLRLVPLTPIHIGDGTEWRPDEYFVEEPAAPGRRYDEFDEEIEESRPPEPSMLCRFDQQAAMRSMTAVQQNQFTTALNRGDLLGAAKLLRQAGRDHVLDRVRLSQASARELRQAMTDPLRGGAVKPFIRSGGAPFIPGSSIKGAFRTALASAALPRGQRPASEWKHASAMAAAFGLDPHMTETDPLRFLSVSDARLTDDATVIDKAEVIKGDGTSPSHSGKRGGIQMHYEVVPGRASMPSSRIAWQCVVTLDARAPWKLPDLLKTTSAFHWTIWQKERQRFFASHQGTCEAMDRLLKAVKVGDSTMAERGPQSAPNYVLLRLGRFGHFESKSLEGVRRGHFPQAKKEAEKHRPPNAWGVTRTITRDTKGNPIPFGWVIGWVVQEEARPC